MGALGELATCLKCIRHTEEPTGADEPYSSFNAYWH